MYKLAEDRHGVSSKIDQKNTLLSLFSKPGDPTSNVADKQAMDSQRRIYDKHRETWMDKAKKKNAFRSTIAAVRPQGSLKPIASMMTGDSSMMRTLDNSAMGHASASIKRIKGGKSTDMTERRSR